MTRRLPRKEGNLNGVVASGASTGRYSFPIGVRYHGLFLKWTHASCALSCLTEIRCKINGKSFIQMSGAELDVRNQVLGFSAYGTTGVLYIPFDRNKLDLVSQEEDTSINTGVADKDGRSIQTFELEVDFNGSQATAVFEVYSVASPKILLNANGEPYGAGTINYVQRQRYTPISGAGTLNVSDFPKVGVEFQAVERMLIYSANDVITNLEVKKNQNTVWNLPTTVADVMLPNGVRTNVAGYQIIDFTFNGDGRPDAPLVLIDADSFDLTITASGDMGSATSAWIFVDYLGGIGK